MPTILKVQGVELSVSVADWEPVRLGAVTRSFSGAPRSSVRATKRSHRFVGDVAGEPVATAELVRQLVEGAGHSWNFDDTSYLTVSSRGLMPYAGGAVSDGSAKWGGVGALFEDGEAATYWAVEHDPAHHTVMWWWYDGENNEWVHFLLRKDGDPYTAAVWRNAVRTDDNPGMVDVDVSGNLYVDQSTYGGLLLDDLAALPYAVPDEWVPGLYALRSTQAWAPLPLVTCSGEGFPEGTVRCVGQGGTAGRLPLRTAGVFGLGELVSFTLEQT